jgi:hypothetical protein
MEDKEVSNIFVHPSAAFVILPAGINILPPVFKPGRNKKSSTMPYQQLKSLD